MIRSLALIAALCVGVSNAYVVGSGVSGFGGSVLVTGASNVASMEMKKGKANVPPQMRQQYARQQEMASQREQMIAATKPGDDGLPVFNLFVRSGLKNVSRSSIFLIHVECNH